MSLTSQTLAMYTQLMAINALSFAGGQYTVAYHALVAALHCAQDLRDGARALAVLQRADEQREAITRQAPDQCLANRSSEWQQRVSGYNRLAHQAQMVDVLLQRQRREEAIH